jgi:hypothetical protein
MMTQKDIQTKTQLSISQANLSDSDQEFIGHLWREETDSAVKEVSHFSASKIAKTSAQKRSFHISPSHPHLFKSNLNPSKPALPPRTRAPVNPTRLAERLTRLAETAPLQVEGPKDTEAILPTEEEIKNETEDS